MRVVLKMRWRFRFAVYGGTNSPTRNWLGASPDGVFSLEDGRLGLVEIKLVTYCCKDMFETLKICLSEILVPSLNLWCLLQMSLQ